MGRSITVEGDFLMEEEKKGKSEISIRAEKMANEIWEKASAVNTDWYADLVLRLEKSMKRAQEKRDFKKYMKDGVRFVTENSDKISMYKIVRSELKCIIGVGIMATDDSRVKFTTAVCICAPPDFDRWSDKTAKGYIGNRLRESGYEIEYDYNIDEKNIVNGIQLRILSDALLNFSGPAFLRKKVQAWEKTSFSFKEIKLGRKRDKRDSE
jgi:hypothetical protein